MKKKVWILLWSLPFIFLLFHFFYFPSFHNDGKIVVAVIDSGVDYKHEELKGRVIKGKDFVDDDNDPMDENGHGTHVASQILERTKEAEVLAIRTLNEEGKGKGKSFLAVLYALHKGADIVNMSYSENYNPFVRALFWYGEKRGVLFVASTGNDGKESINFPAGYSGVVPIGAINEFRDELYEEGNIDESVEFVAPGVDVEGASLLNGHMFLSGTSMATGYASGVMAYILENHPEMTREEMLRYLETHAETTKEGTFYQLDYDRFVALENKKIPYGKLTKVPEIIDQHTLTISVETINVDKIEGFDEKRNLLFSKKNSDDTVKILLPKEGYQVIHLRFYNGEDFQERSFGIIKDTKVPEIRSLSTTSGVIGLVFTETSFESIKINGKNANSSIQRNRQEDYSYHWVRPMEEEGPFEIEIRDKVGHVTKEIIKLDKPKNKKPK